MKKSFLSYYFLFKYLILVLDVVFLGGIIYYIRKLRLINKLRDSIREKFGVRFFVPTGTTKKWKNITSLLKESYPSSWKLAVLQATALVERTLQNLGYKGETLKDFLQTLQIQKYRHLDLIEKVHEIRERIIKDKDFALSREEALRIVSLLKKFWQDIISQFI